MIFVFGIRTARIGHFIDNDHLCYQCRAYEREINVYRSYFHFCAIPVFPVGRNKIDIHCKNCGNETQTESLVDKYTNGIKTPIWMYSAIGVSIAIASAWFYWNQSTLKRNRTYIANPLIGDVYTLVEEKNTGSTYYFIKLIGKKGDSILAQPSNLEYGYPIDKMEKDDYFVKDDTMAFGKNELEAMFEKGEVYSINRDKEEK